MKKITKNCIQCNINPLKAGRIKFCSGFCYGQSKIGIEPVHATIKSRLVTIGKKRPIEVIEKIKISKEKRKQLLGYVNSPETRKKISITQTGKKRGPMNDSHRKAISLSNTGKKRNAEVCEKYRQSTLKRLSNPENHPRWNPNRNEVINRGTRFGSELHRWRREIKKRDNNCCKINNHDCSGVLECHHILPWSDFPELRFDINNGILLCKYHHPLKKSDVIRLSTYFTNLISKNI